MIPSLRPIFFLFAGLLAAVETGPPATDGWCGQSVQVVLGQPGVIAPLVIQGMVPALGQGEFQPVLCVTVDGQEVSRSPVGPGAFELRAVVIGAAEVRHVSLSFSETRRLPAPDARAVAARIDRITLEPLGPGGNTWLRGGFGGGTDVVIEGGPIGLGKGWYPYETYQGVSFRWMGNEAEICIRPDVECRLAIEAEAGPTTSGGTCDLRIIDHGGRLVDKVRIGNRAVYEVLVPALAASAQPLRLRIDGVPARTPGDRRTLGMRVFAITERR
jgi:hypothetical protein